MRTAEDADDELVGCIEIADVEDEAASEGMETTSDDEEIEETESSSDDEVMAAVERPTEDDEYTALVENVESSASDVEGVVVDADEGSETMKGPEFTVRDVSLVAVST